MLLATVWVTLIKGQVYRATVTLNIDLFAEERGGASSFSTPFFVQDVMVANKIGVVEQYFESEEFKSFFFDLLQKGDVPGERSDLASDDIAIIQDELKKRKVTSKEDVIEWFHDKLDLKGFNERSRIDLISSASRPMLAAAIANIGAQALIEYNRLMLVQRLTHLKKFLDQQTGQAKRELHNLENKLVALQKSARIISPDEVRAKVNSLQVDQEAKLIDFDRQFAALNSLIGETENDLAYFKKMMSENKPASYLYIEQIQRRLEVLRYQKAQESTPTSANPSGLKDPILDRGIESVVTELAKQLETLGPISQSPWDYVKKIELALFDLKNKRQQAQSELAAQQIAVQRTAKQFIGLPETLKQMSEVKRSIDLSTSLYTALMSRLQDTQIKEAAHSNDLIMVSSAELPVAPAGLGKAKTVLLSVVIGLALACLPLFLRFVLLPTLRGANDLRHLRVPLIGSLGWFRSSPVYIDVPIPRLLSGILKRKSWQIALSPSFPIGRKSKMERLLVESPSSAEANSLRFVRFQMEQLLQIRAYQAGKASKLLQISSVNPKEGRTFVAANLADLFAASGVRTCLVDLDFGNPAATQFFPEVMTDNSPMAELFPKACDFEMLRVNDKLTIMRPKTGSYGPMSEVLETREFESALNALEVIYELVILDTPPFTGHMEPVVTAQYADALLLVINQRKTLRSEVEDAIRRLQNTLKLPIFGMLNFTFDEMSNSRRKYKHIKTQQSPAQDEVSSVRPAA